MIFHVLPKQENQTVATALREWLPGKSWGQIRRLMKGRQIMVSGNLCVDAGRRLKLQDVVKVLPQPAAPPPRADDIKIRFLDEHVAVVEKPAGMTSNRHKEEEHWPAKRKQLQPTLDELLPQVIARTDPRLRKRKGIPPPVRAVHRLDRETSGLMVFARTVRAERNLGEQFRHHTTFRRYIAIVQSRGRPPRQHPSAERRQAGHHAYPAARPTARLHHDRMPIGNRPHASDPNSFGRAGQPCLRR
jgi:23S rRNA pseudouridine1911/1915/1917 synthase